MADEAPALDESSPLLADLDEAERRELAMRHYVKKDRDLVWIEPEGAVRREAVASLYYVRTARGVFRVSRINGRVVEV